MVQDRDTDLNPAAGRVGEDGQADAQDRQGSAVAQQRVQHAAIVVEQDRAGIGRLQAIQKWHEVVTGDVLRQLARRHDLQARRGNGLPGPVGPVRCGDCPRVRARAERAGMDDPPGLHVRTRGVGGPGPASPAGRTRVGGM